MRLGWELSLLAAVVPWYVPSLQAQKVLISRTGSAIHWTCFEVDSVEACCNGIQSASNRSDVPTCDLESCFSTLATVPPTLQNALGVPANGVGRYSLVTENQDLRRNAESKQYLWSNINTTSWELEEIENITSPLLLGLAEPTDAVSLVSELPASGGMHRLLQHQVTKPTTVQTIFVFVTVVEFFFIDLDDAYEGYEHLVRIHSSGVCDIEEPSFVSSQHLIILELSTDGEMEVEFSSKLHIRYAPPSPKHTWQAMLPRPYLVCKMSDGSLSFPADEKDSDGQPLHVWVAAGNDGDYDTVVWTTVMACFLGVAWMIMDISSVSKWDNF